MVPHTHRGALTMTEAAPDNVLIQNKIPDSGTIQVGQKLTIPK